MEVAKVRHIGRIAAAGFWTIVLTSTPALAQEGGLSVVEMFQTMGTTAIIVAIVLFIMSFWSIGVAIERIYTFNKARATLSGCKLVSVLIWIARSAPMASPVRNCCWHSSPPQEITMTSDAWPASLILSACSSAISSKGLMLFLTPSVSIPLPLDSTRTRTL